MNLNRQHAWHEPDPNISPDRDITRTWVQHSCNTTINSEFYNTTYSSFIHANFGIPLYTNKVSHLIRSNIFGWNLTVKNVIANYYSPIGSQQYA